MVARLRPEEQRAQRPAVDRQHGGENRARRRGRRSASIGGQRFGCRPSTSGPPPPLLAAPLGGRRAR
eukprot:11191850-Lingulodinium_polyedra.AAC.1